MKKKEKMYCVHCGDELIGTCHDGLYFCGGIRDDGGHTPAVPKKLLKEIKKYNKKVYK